MTTNLGSRLILVEAEFSCVKSGFPSLLQPNDFIGRHIRRNTLEDTELEIVRVALSQLLVSAVAGYAVIEPPPQNILGAVGCANISAAIGGIQNVVDATPLPQRSLPLRR